MSPNEKLKVTEMQCLSCKNMIPAGLENCDVCGKTINYKINQTTPTTESIIQKQEIDEPKPFMFGSIGVVMYILGLFLRWISREGVGHYGPQMELSFTLFIVGTMFFFIAILTKK